jgi:hypothetical protein
MNTSWGTKATYRRKRAILRTKVRWSLLGLEDPAQASSTLSIDDIRRQISSAASQGLSADTVSRSLRKNQRPKPGSKASVASGKRGAAS